MTRKTKTSRTDGHGNPIYREKNGSEYVVRDWTTTKKGAIKGRIYSPF